MVRITPGGGLRAAACLFLLLTLSAGCSLHSGVMPQPPTGRDALRLDVPFHAQEEYQCGPAALAMTLNWSGLNIAPDDLTEAVYTPSRQGSLQPDMITAARRRGRIAYPIHGAQRLMAEVDANNPVIVLQNLGLSWYPVWHYAVVIGYDRTTAEILLHSGLTPDKRTPFRVFENTWGSSDFWGLLVLPPERMPATVTEGEWLDAAVGLERARQWQAAATAYTAATARWPLSHDAWIGLGNARYSLHDVSGSEAAFRRATEAQPDSGVAFNNLAFVLAELGRREEALEAARTAVKLGGTQEATFRRTLSEIENR